MLLSYYFLRGQKPVRTGMMKIFYRIFVPYFEYQYNSFWRVVKVLTALVEHFELLWIEMFVLLTC